MPQPGSKVSDFPVPEWVNRIPESRPFGEESDIDESAVMAELSEIRRELKELRQERTSPLLIGHTAMNEYRRLFGCGDER